MTKRETLDKVFSEYIRQRDCPDGVGRCITCGRVITPATCDAGHYISRRVTATRWNGLNVNAQCRACNRFSYGKENEYRLALISRYGLYVVEELEDMAKREVHMRDSDYDALITVYKNLLYGKS